MPNLKVALAGEGGQGVQAIAAILAEAAFAAGREVLYIPSFGVEQRGGVSLAYVQLGDEPVGAPRFDHADIAVALSLRAVDRVRQHVGPDTLLVYDQGLADAVGRVYGGRRQALAVPALERASRELTPRVFNIIILGALVELIGLVPPAAIKTALEERLGHRFARDPVLREQNLAALDLGQRLARPAGREV